MTTPPPASGGTPGPTAGPFYTVSATIICRTHADAMDAVKRIEQVFEAERQALIDRPSEPHRVLTFAAFVIQMGAGAVRGLLLELAKIGAGNPSTIGVSGPVATAMVNAIRRSQSAGGN